MENEDQILRIIFDNSAVKYEPPEELTPEEEQKRLDFIWETHECSGASNAKTWLVPGSREFWLVFGDKPERMTWITYCPYCGYKPSDKQIWW